MNSHTASMHVILLGAKLGAPKEKFTITIRTLCELVHIFSTFSVQSFPFSCTTTHITYIKSKSTFMHLFERQEQAIISINILKPIDFYVPSDTLCGLKAEGGDEVLKSRDFSP